jgi:hypothetical protein
MHDIVNNIAVTQVLAPQTLQAAALGSGIIDRQGAETLVVAVLVGAMGDTLDSTNRIDLKIEHADDDGTGAPAAFASCTAEDVAHADEVTDGIFFSVDDDEKAQARHVVGYRGAKRFVKVTATPVSLSTGGPIAMLALKGAAAQAPVDNS